MVGIGFKMLFMKTPATIAVPPPVAHPVAVKHPAPKVVPHAKHTKRTAPRVKVDPT